MGGSAASMRVVREAGLTGLVRPGSAHTTDELGSQRQLPVLPELRPLLPGGGLRRGTTVGISTSSTAPSAAGPIGGAAARAGAGVRPQRAVAGLPVATSVLLALLVEASRAGSWCAVVGLPTLGVAAAAELGIALDRLALVAHPGAEWPTVVAALLDGFDVVAVAAPAGVTPAVASRLAARARQRGGVLVPFGPWHGADLTLEAADPVWHGIEDGHGRLRGRQVSITARGRGASAAPRLTHLWLPRPTGVLADLGPMGEIASPIELDARRPVPGAEPPGVSTVDSDSTVDGATVHELRPRAAG
ncbi:hypothetical protein Val02_67580 [Virgisporangium aliadipatigenens]|uniref:Uncharacterized protein n=1 Tax=Virgisporangium aliadipatigenens TaxID=741659 RepID=A0A8J4DV76_9ACTN|nr:hypothetical protein [Virgisporangium aliadipatigenens]GIJ49872.1 hypothetical protein Val02_67580 [Virgisporangium aliadipatigenens]